MGLKHFRHLRGYANVIGKAEELTESGKANAEVAIETSGHCAMQENGYVDDGMYVESVMPMVVNAHRYDSLFLSYLVWHTI